MCCIEEVFIYTYYCLVYDIPRKNEERPVATCSSHKHGLQPLLCLLELVVCSVHVLLEFESCTCCSYDSNDMYKLTPPQPFRFCLHSS